MFFLGVDLSREGQVVDGLVGQFSFYYQYNIPTSTPAVVHIMYQGVLFPDLETCISVYTRTCDLGRIADNLPLLSHVENRHRFLSDRASHMLVYYGSDEMYGDDAERCRSIISIIEALFNYPPMDGDEELDLDSDDEEEGLERGPHPVPSRLLPAPEYDEDINLYEQSTIMIRPEANGNRLTSRVACMITKAQIVLRFGERDVQLSLMSFNPNAGFTRAPYYRQFDAVSARRRAAMPIILPSQRPIPWDRPPIAQGEEAAIEQGPPQPPVTPIVPIVQAPVAQGAQGPIVQDPVAQGAQGPIVHAPIAPIVQAPIAPIVHAPIEHHPVAQGGQAAIVQASIVQAPAEVPYRAQLDFTAHPELVLPALVSRTLELQESRNPPHLQLTAFGVAEAAEGVRMTPALTQPNPREPNLALMRAITGALGHHELGRPPHFQGIVFTLGAAIEELWAHQKREEDERVEQQRIEELEYARRPVDFTLAALISDTLGSLVYDGPPYLNSSAFGVAKAVEDLQRRSPDFSRTELLQTITRALGSRRLRNANIFTLASTIEQYWMRKASEVRDRQIDYRLATIIAFALRLVKYEGHPHFQSVVIRLEKAVSSANVRNANLVEAITAVLDVRELSWINVTRLAASIEDYWARPIEELEKALPNLQLMIAINNALNYEQFDEPPFFSHVVIRMAGDVVDGGDTRSSERQNYPLMRLCGRCLGNEDELDGPPYFCQRIIDLANAIDNHRFPQTTTSVSTQTRSSPTTSGQTSTSAYSLASTSGSTSTDTPSQDTAMTILAMRNGTASPDGEYYIRQNATNQSGLSIAHETIRSYIHRHGGGNVDEDEPVSERHARFEDLTVAEGDNVERVHSHPQPPMRDGLSTQASTSQQPSTSARSTSQKATTSATTTSQQASTLASSISAQPSTSGTSSRIVKKVSSFFLQRHQNESESRRIVFGPQPSSEEIVVVSDSEGEDDEVFVFPPSKPAFWTRRSDDDDDDDGERVYHQLQNAVSSSPDGGQSGEQDRGQDGDQEGMQDGNQDAMEEEDQEGGQDAMQVENQDGGQDGMQEEDGEQDGARGGVQDGDQVDDEENARNREYRKAFNRARAGTLYCRRLVNQTIYPPPLELSFYERVRKFVDHKWFTMQIHMILSVILSHCVSNTIKNKINVRELKRRCPDFIDSMRNNTMTRVQLSDVRRYARSLSFDLYKVVGVFNGRLSEGCMGFFFIYDPYCDDCSDIELLKLLFAIGQCVQFHFLRNNTQAICSNVFNFAPDTEYTRDVLDKAYAIFAGLDRNVKSTRFPTDIAGVFDATSGGSYIRFREPLMTETQWLKRRRMM